MNVVYLGEGVIAVLGFVLVTVGLVFAFRGQITKETVNEQRAEITALRGTVEFERGECARKIKNLELVVERLSGRLDQQDDRHADRIVDKVIAKFEIRLKEPT